MLYGMGHPLKHMFAMGDARESHFSLWAERQELELAQEKGKAQKTLLQESKFEGPEALQVDYEEWRYCAGYRNIIPFLQEVRMLIECGHQYHPKIAYHSRRSHFAAGFRVAVPSTSATTP
ncbi:peptidyl-tRNA hydrolase II family protein [Striga asiatica]|uniref:Peptidyl-tRNA hydrolase II family protein n=1 Tax=Striga asiatica TaxID=4170 RepID=A0A5A7QQW0_STRAF|nr:peptidyl-tRNA hydrolase II family protein [Striga asiatica]